MPPPRPRPRSVGVRTSTSGRPVPSDERRRRLPPPGAQAASSGLRRHTALVTVVAVGAVASVVGQGMKLGSGGGEEEGGRGAGLGWADPELQEAYGGEAEQLLPSRRPQGSWCAAQHSAVQRRTEIRKRPNEREQKNLVLSTWWIEESAKTASNGRRNFTTDTAAATLTSPCWCRSRCR